jgi:hypothetical protein
MSKNVQQEREREWTSVSVLVINFLNDERILDPNAVADEFQFDLDTMLDGDIPVHIRAAKKCYGPIEVEWELWRSERGQRTRGTATIHRMSGTDAILEAGFYERSRSRSPRLAKLRVPYAKWGLRSSLIEQSGIETTY